MVVGRSIIDTDASGVWSGAGGRLLITALVGLSLFFASVADAPTMRDDVPRRVRQHFDDIRPAHHWTWTIAPKQSKAKPVQKRSEWHSLSTVDPIIHSALHCRRDPLLPYTCTNYTNTQVIPSAPSSFYTQRHHIHTQSPIHSQSVPPPPSPSFSSSSSRALPLGTQRRPPHAIKSSYT